MQKLINIEAFRQYYDEMIACKTVLNANAEQLNQADENNLEALMPIEDKYGREMLKRLVANAVLQNSNHYSDTVRHWADNAVISMFIYETDHVLSEYIPDHLSEAALEAVAKNLIQKEKEREYAKSCDGTEYEVLKQGRCCTLVSHEMNDILFYACVPAAPLKADTTLFFDRQVENESFSYCDANRAFQDMEKTLGHNAEAMAVLDQQYLAFKNEMLSKSPKELFESCFRIAAVEDVYFYVTENKIFKPKEKEYILNSGDCVLTDLMQDWYEYGDWNDEVTSSVENTFNERMSEYQKSLDSNEDDEEIEL